MGASWLVPQVPFLSNLVCVIWHIFILCAYNHLCFSNYLSIYLSNYLSIYQLSLFELFQCHGCCVAAHPPALHYDSSEAPLFDVKSSGRQRKKRLRSRNVVIDEWLQGEDGTDTYVDLEDFLVF